MKRKREIKTAQINIRVKPSEKQRLDVLSERMGISIVELIMMGVELIEAEERRNQPAARTGTVADFYSGLLQ